MFDKFMSWLDRAKSRVYSIFIFWLIIFFSPIVFTTLFMDQSLIYEKRHLLKNEYIAQTYLNLGTQQGWVYLLTGIVGALILTWLTIWKFPDWFVNPSHKKETENQMKRDIYQLRKEQELEREKKKLANEQIETTKALVEFAEQKEELETKEEDLWRKDYLSFRKTKYFKMFHHVKTCLYEYGGRTYVSAGYSDLPPEFELDSDMAPIWMPMSCQKHQVVS